MRSALQNAIERQRATNQPINAPMKIIETLISTQKGWLIRQALKGAAALGTVATTWLVSHGVAIDNPQAVTAALATLATGLAEMALSKLASKIAAS